MKYFRHTQHTLLCVPEKLHMTPESKISHESQVKYICKYKNLKQCVTKIKNF
jgi:hypothetical protein